MRAIRDNEEAANAMGKNVVKQHLLIFVLGSAIVGIAGAMLVTQDGLFTPGSYRPMRYTFVIWVMVIVGGTGNNFGAILGGFAVWFLWIEAAPIGLYLVNLTTAGLDDTHALKVHLIESVPYFRFLMIRRPPRSTLSSSSAASDVYKRQLIALIILPHGE